MSFVNPAALWLLTLAIPVIVLHILRPRRHTVEVSSTFLWQQVARPVSAAAPWQKLRPSVLLLLQLLAIVLLATAVARPVRVTAAPLAKHTVFIIDASGSMAAKDGDDGGDGSFDRLDAAKDRARDLRDQLPSGGVASIVVASDRPRVVLTSSADRTAFDSALSPISTTAGRADWSTAFLLAQSLETPGEPIGFLIVSDGGLTEIEQRLIPAGSRYVKVGERSANRAITRLTVEPRGSGLHARITLANTGGPAATQTVRLDVDGHTAAHTSVRLDEGGIKEVDIDLPGGDRVEAFLEGDDLLDADDHAYATATRRRPLTVLLAGPADPFLETFLASTADITVQRSETSVAASGADLAIYDRVAVPANPGAPFLAIAPPGGMPAAGVEIAGAGTGTAPGTVEHPAITLVDSEDPLVAGLDLSDTAIAAAQGVDAPAADVVVGAEQTPLLLRGNYGDRAFAYLTFALADSNLPVQVAFPILADRLLTELAGAAVPPASLVVGDNLPIDPATPATIKAPGGTTIEAIPGSPAPLANRPGFWTISVVSRPDQVIAVNADPAESKLLPAPSLLTPERRERPGEHRPAGERSLQTWVVVPLLVLLVFEWLVSRRRRGVSTKQWRWATGLRIAIAGLLILSLFDPAIIRPARRVATMFLVDGSDSLGSAGRADAVSWVKEALSHQPRGALAGVAVFGGDARLELTMQQHANLEQPAVRIDATHTNLANALRLAAAVLPTDARRRIVIVSDGRATDGDAAVEAQQLASDGIEVDYRLVSRRGGSDVAVAGIDTPSKVREGESFTITVTIEATKAGPVKLTLLRDGVVVDERIVDVPAGRTTIPITQVAGAAGLARYQVRVSAAGDAVGENDAGYAAVEVEGQAAVLIAEGSPGEGAHLADALRSGGLRVDVVPAGSLPPLDALTTYAATVLVDVPLHALTSDQIATLRAATRDLGHGLVTVGGTSSYGLGGYLGSEMEELLPVISEITDPKRRQSVAEVLAIDSSGSMGACHCAEGDMPSNRLGGGVQKTDIARAAAARAIDALNDNDEVGVLAFNTERRWAIDLQKLPSDQVVNDGLASIEAAGGTNLRDVLQQSAEKLRSSKASLKHIILFTDGFTDPDALEGLADEAAGLLAEGITVSVLATGEGAAQQLSAIAEAGGGRFYPGRDLQQIPQLMMEEAITASRDFITEGNFLPEVTSSATVVRDLTSAPPLLGYVAATAKPTAQTHLRIGPDRDPLLASWQLGLGRVTSWMSDASDRWSQHWASWDGYVNFWSGVVKDTFATGSGGAVQAKVEEGRLKLTVEQAETFPDGATATARVTGPDLQGHDVTLERTTGNTFSGEVEADQAGTYAVGATVNGSNGTLLTGSTLASQSYAAEYRPGEADRQALTRISTLSNGRGEIEAAQAFDSADLRAGRSRISLTAWLLLLAILLWPIAVALSRLALRGALVAAARERASRFGELMDWRRRRGGQASTSSARPTTQAGDSTSSPSPPRRSQSGRRSGTPAPPPAPPPTLDRLLQRKRGGDPAAGGAPAADPDEP